MNSLMRSEQIFLIFSWNRCPATLRKKGKITVKISEDLAFSILRDNGYNYIGDSVEAFEAVWGFGSFKTDEATMKLNIIKNWQMGLNPEP